MIVLRAYDELQRQTCSEENVIIVVRVTFPMKKSSKNIPKVMLLQKREKFDGINTIVKLTIIFFN